MDKNIFLMVYKCLIRSVLDYGPPEWNPSTITRKCPKTSDKILPRSFSSLSSSIDMISPSLSGDK